MTTLKDWLKATLWCRGVDDFEKTAKTWPKDRRAKVAKMLGEIRMQGFYPDRIDEHDCIVWGVALKGHVQIEMDRNSEKYERIGNQIKTDLAHLLRSVDEVMS